MIVYNVVINIYLSYLFVTTYTVLNRFLRNKSPSLKLKKLLFIILAVTILSCTSDDGQEETQMYYGVFIETVCGDSSTETYHCISESEHAYFKGQIEPGNACKDVRIKYLNRNTHSGILRTLSEGNSRGANC